MRQAILLFLFFLFSAPVPATAGEAPTGPRHALSIFGEPKYPADFEHFEYVNPDAPKGGEIKLAAFGTFDSFHPFILKGNQAAGVGMLFESLMEGSVDEPFSNYGLLAESVEVAPDSSWVAFVMRKEARFHDGSPVTAEDVLFSFNTLKEKGHPFYLTYYRDVTKAEIDGDRRVKFTFKDGGNRELPLIMGQLPVISKKYFTEHDFEKPGTDIPVGSGPYRIASFDTGRSITYTRDPDYWGKDLPLNKGRNNFGTIRYDYYRDETVAVEALKAGQYDIRQENISRLWATAYNDVKGLKEGMFVREEIPHSIPSGMQAFVINTRRDKFKDIAIRKALNLAYDFEWSNKSLFYGAYKRTTSYFSNSPFASSGLPQGKELELLNRFKDKLPPELFTKPYKVPTTDGSGNNRENLRAAKKVLEDAGWKVKDGALIDPASGKPMEIEFLIDSPSFERVVAPFIKTLKTLGINGRIRNVDSAQYEKRMDGFDYDIVVHTFGQSMSPGNEQIDYWHSSRVDMHGSKNFAGVNDPVVDALVEAVLNAQSAEELEAACRALDRVLLWGYYVVPNWFNQSFRMIYWNKFGKPDVRPKYALGFLDTWWIDEAKNNKLKEWRRGK